jgi:formyl-CoA transferase
MTGALDGIRVIDATRVLGGPFCTQVLADHGAEVIKVEPPQGDETRGWGPPFADGTASYFLGINRNKKGMVVDLARPAGQELLGRLLEHADVFVENFKTGTLEKWGLGHESLAKRFPKLIHCRVSGFGADGPYGGLPGYDAAIQAMAGLMSVNGEKGGEPLRIGVPVVDLVTGLNAAIGILMALHERTTSGKGQFVEAALYDCGISLLHPQLPNYYLNGNVPKSLGNAHPNICPYDVFHTASDPLFLAVGNNRQFEIMCRTIGRTDLAADPRFADNATRLENASALKAEIEGAFAAHDGPALARMLIEAGVPCGPVRSIDAVVDDPHTKHRGMVIEAAGYRGTGAPVKLSRTPAAFRSKPPAFAEHTDAVLEELGIDPAPYRDVLPRERKG